MSLQAIRSAIAATLLAVPNIGVVHEYERYSHDLAKLKELYYSKAHRQLRGWFVRRTATKENGILPPRYLEEVNWQIRGVISLDDGAQSELVMDELIEAVRDAFRANRTLSGTVLKIGQLPATASRGLQMDDFGPVMFGGVLCHGVRLSLVTTRELNQ
jgi:hypothetical protein